MVRVQGRWLLGPVKPGANLELEASAGISSTRFPSVVRERRVVCGLLREILRVLHLEPFKLLPHPSYSSTVIMQLWLMRMFPEYHHPAMLETTCVLLSPCIRTSQASPFLPPPTTSL